MKINSLKMSFFFLVYFCLISCDKLDYKILNTYNESLISEEKDLEFDKDKVMASLSAIMLRKKGYFPYLRDSISAYLERPDLETKGDWELIWFDQGNNRIKDRCTTFIAKHKRYKNTLAIVSKGINLYSITEWANALNIFVTAKHPYLPQGDDAYISKGLKNVLNSFEELSSRSDLSPKSDISVFDYINLYCKLRKGEKVNFYLTGHSLGGIISTSISPKIVKILENNKNDGSNVSVWTYAEPSLYNEGFVNSFKKLLEHEKINFSYKRIFLADDPFPTQCAWKLEKPSEISYPIGLSLSYKLDLSFRMSKALLKLNNIHYAQLGTEKDYFVYKIPNNLADKRNFGLPEVIKTYVDLAKYIAWNHSTDSYMLSLGMKCIPLYSNTNQSHLFSLN